MIKKIIRKHYEKNKNKNPIIEPKIIISGFGLLITIITGLFKLEGITNKIVITVLISLGIIIGLLNIKTEECTNFLLAMIVFVTLFQQLTLALIKGFSIQNTEIIGILGRILINFIYIFVPAALLVSIKIIFAPTKNK